MRSRLAWVSVYALAMAYFEATVVVYLRGLLRYGSATVELGGYYRIEVGREAATLVMLLAVGWLAGKTWRERLAYSLLGFGLWDLGYYAWLKVMTGWPESFFSPDVLFMIPVRWTGPVLAPALIAGLMCLMGLVWLQKMERLEELEIGILRIAALGLGAILVLLTFTVDAIRAYLQGNSNWNDLYPGRFNWPLFLLALALMAWPIFQSMLKLIYLQKRQS